MDTKIRKGNLIITLPLQKPTLSSSKKSLVVASSRGVRKLAAIVDGKNIHLAANAWIYPEEAQKSKKKATFRRMKGSR